MQNINLTKEIYGLNTYRKAVDTSFSELIVPRTDVTPTPTISVSQFFDYYQQLFFDIPISGSVNSHIYLVQTSQDYIGGSVLDAEKQALIEEINSLRRQLLDLNVNFDSLNNIV